VDLAVEQANGASTLEPKDAAILCARTLSDKLARDIAVLDVQALVDIADYFVVCTGINERQIRSMVEDLRHAMAEHGLPKLGIEGTVEAKWVLFDMGDVIVHIFTQEARSFYDLEMLWGDAPRVEWDAAAKAGEDTTPA